MYECMPRDLQPNGKDKVNNISTIFHIWLGIELKSSSIIYNRGYH